MQSVSDDVFWCPRCGTVKQQILGNEYTPDLVTWIENISLADRRRVVESELDNIQRDISKPVESDNE
jgi:hypothetical protein